jgi:hypothetical protein
MRDKQPAAFPDLPSAWAETPRHSARRGAQMSAAGQMDTSKNLAAAA